MRQPAGVRRKRSVKTAVRLVVPANELPAAEDDGGVGAKGCDLDPGECQRGPSFRGCRIFSGNDRERFASRA